jgi:hypothetical protein
MAIPLLGAVDKPKRLLADKAYDANSFRHWLKRRKIKAVISSTATRLTPYPLDQKIGAAMSSSAVLQFEKLATHRNPI